MSVPHSASAPKARRWIVVLGAPSLADGSASPAQTRRLEAALAKAQPGDCFVLMGAAVINEHPESQTMAAWLTQSGVSESSIWTESDTRSTRDQARLLARLMQEARPERVWVVSDPTHLKRVTLLLERANAPMGAIETVASEADPGGFWSWIIERLNYAKDWLQTLLGIWG